MCSVFVCDCCAAWYVCTGYICCDVYGVMCGMRVIQQVCMVWCVYVWCGVWFVCIVVCMYSLCDVLCSIYCGMYI